MADAEYWFVRHVLSERDERLRSRVAAASRSGQFVSAADARVANEARLDDAVDLLDISPI
jgi:hypothetical protein